MKLFGDRVKDDLPDIYMTSGEPMSGHTTFRIGGKADLFAVPTEKELPILLELAREYRMPVTVVGNGSNVLVADKGIRGLVIVIGSGMDGICVEDNRVLAGAGALLSRTAVCAAEAGLGGVEFSAGIPGSVGGAIVMNAGAYGGEIKDIVRSVKVLTLDGTERSLSRGEMEFGYRHSCVPEREFIVTAAEFELAPKSKEEIRAQMADLRERRIEKQPLEFPSAGSTFKRPPGYFAGKLIMDAGLAGYTVGGAQVSEKHCGFVINRGGATAAEVRQLIADVRDRVRSEFGVELEPEVKMLGEFE